MPPRGSMLRHIKFHVYGVVFIAVVAMLLGLTIAMYNKAFTPVDRVTLYTDRIGNQLTPPADVKLRGIIVGEVRSVRAEGDRAALDLAMKPDLIKLVPSNVSARLLPKTLFGEKYVDLVIPARPSAQALRAGDGIAQDRTKVAIETEKVLDDLFPLLRAVHPAKLSATLNALSTSLEGRGARIGENVDRLHAYLSQINAHLPAIQEDVKLLARVTDTYADAAPDLLRVLRNATATSGTLVTKRQEIDAFVRSMTSTSDQARNFLGRNGDRIIQLARVSRPTLDVLDAYAPEYPCLLNGLVESAQRLSEAFRDGSLHVTVQLVRQRPAYEPGADDPTWSALPGPDCRGLPTPRASRPAADRGLGDKGQRSQVGPAETSYRDSGLPGLPDMGYAGTAEEQQLVRAVLAPSMGMPADDVPDIATLLFGPMARGTAVSVP